MNLLDTLKQAREALSAAQNQMLERREIWNICSKAERNLTAAIAELEKAEPVAWRYTLSLGPDEIRSECSDINWNEKYQPFGRPGIDFNERGRVTKQPLYLHPSDDGDALRLAVKLGLDVDCDTAGGKTIVNSDIGWYEELHSDPDAATRRAIVRTAAEIGRAMN